MHLGDSGGTNFSKSGEGEEDEAILMRRSAEVENEGFALEGKELVNNYVGKKDLDADNEVNMTIQTI